MVKQRKESAVIVCDAWKNWPEFDRLSFPNLPKETKAFGVYLNHVCSMLKQDYDVWHVANGEPIMDEIDTYPDQVAITVDELPKDYLMYYFCGFHFGRCVSEHAIRLASNSISRKQIGIVFNLSLLFSADSYRNLVVKPTDITLYNYQFGLRGFSTDMAPSWPN